VYSILEDFNQTFNGEKDFKITEFDMRSTDDSILKQYTKDFLTGKKKPLSFTKIGK